MNYLIEVLIAAENLRGKMKDAGFTLALELSPEVSNRDI